MQCLRIVLYSNVYNIKTCSTKKNTPALTCSLPFFLVIRKYRGGEGNKKVNCVLILQLPELCIAKLTSGKVSQ